MQSLHPSLYGLALDGRSLRFLFAKCSHCEQLNFPANAPGCRRCGSPLDAALKVERLAGGRLLEAVTVYVALVPDMAVPRIVGNIEIAPNVVIEGVIDVSDEHVLRDGMELQAIAAPSNTVGFYECTFRPASTEVAE